MNQKKSLISLKSLQAMSLTVQKAKQLMQELGITRLENMASLAKKLHIPIKYVSFRSSKVGGFAAIDDDGCPYIAVNSLTHPVYQELTIGEEIGHHILKHHEQQDRDEEILDAEAKIFSCTLLMHSDAKISIAEFDDHNPDLAVMDSFAFLFNLFPNAIDNLTALNKFIQATLANESSKEREAR